MRYIWLMIKVLPIEVSEGPKVLLDWPRRVSFIAVNCFLSWSCESRRGRHQDAISFLPTLQPLTAPSTLIVCGALRTRALPTSHFPLPPGPPVSFALSFTHHIRLHFRVVPALAAFWNSCRGFLPNSYLRHKIGQKLATVGRCRLSAGHGSAHA